MNQIRPIEQNASAIRDSRNAFGFTIIEMVIVLAVIGLISAVAIPSYTNYIVRANRADAKDALTQTMFELERFYTRNRTYTTTLGAGGLGLATVDSPEGNYELTAAACSGSTIARCVILTATPKAGTRQDGDGVLTLTSRGEKNAKWDAR